MSAVVVSADMTAASSGSDMLGEAPVEVLLVSVGTASSTFGTTRSGPRRLWIA